MVAHRRQLRHDRGGDRGGHASSTTTSASSSSTSSPTPLPRASRSSCSGSAVAQVPLPLPVLMLLAFDVGTETLPSLALGRDPSAPGIMEQAPRDPNEPLIQKPMLVRAWLFLGVIVSALAFVGFFYVLLNAGWHPGDPTGQRAPASPRLPAGDHDVLARDDGGSDRDRVRGPHPPRAAQIGRRLHQPLAAEGDAGVIAFAALFMYAPPLQRLLGTARAAAALPGDPAPVSVHRAGEQTSCGAT